MIVQCKRGKRDGVKMHTLPCFFSFENVSDSPTAWSVLMVAIGGLNNLPTVFVAERPILRGRRREEWPLDFCFSWRKQLALRAAAAAIREVPALSNRLLQGHEPNPVQAVGKTTCKMN